MVQLAVVLRGQLRFEASTGRIRSASGRPWRGELGGDDIDAVVKSRFGQSRTRPRPYGRHSSMASADSIGEADRSNT